MLNIKIKNIAFIVISILIIVLVNTLINSCKHDTININEFPEVIFSTQILPIFQANCAKSGCHDGISEEGGRFNFSNYEGIMAAIKPGYPDNSVAYTALADIWGNIMPPDRPLSLEQRSLIRIWILQGAKNNIDTTGSVCDTNNITFSGTINKMLNDNCLSCHSNINAPVLGANIRLEDYADVVAKANRVLGSIQHKPGFFAMPKNKAQLDTCKIIQFAIWVNKLNITDTTTADTSIYATRACFQRDILPVLVSSCAMSSCHDNVSHQGDYILTSYAHIMQAVQPYYPNESVLYTSIKGTGEEDIMPPAGYTQLTQAQIDSIRNWILYGALDEQCFSSSCDTSNVTFSGTVWPIINTYCKGCHSTSNPSGGYNLDNYSNIHTYAKSGILMNALKGNGVPLMPLGTTLTKCKIDQVNKWVKNGAQNN